MAFGPHLLVELYGCNKNLYDLTKLAGMLETIVDLAGMTKITPPYVFNYKGKIPEDWGSTGFIVLAESHCSYHTFVEKDFVAFDLFSCREFKHDEIVDYLSKFFGANQVNFEIKERGEHFTRNE